MLEQIWWEHLMKKIKEGGPTSLFIKKIGSKPGPKKDTVTVRRYKDGAEN